jgi:hypothetical protein
VAYLLTHFWPGGMPLMPIEGGLVGPPEERSGEIVNSDGLSA